MTYDASTSFHLIGIGGIGVSGVARILHERGFTVSGSDIRESSITEALRDEGIEVDIGHNPSNLEGVDVVVRSTAIPDDNDELLAAREREIPVVHRSDLLQELIDDYRVIGVTGTHGKGTVSSMIAWILETAGWDPGFIIGGMLNNFSTNARDSGGRWMVVEIDESDGTHHNFEPDYLLCNFLELDHLNYYDGLDDIIGSMREFLQENPRLKEAFVNLDCEGNRRMVEDLAMRPTGYSTEHRSEFRGELKGPEQLPIEFEASHRGDSLGDFELNLPGLYNVVNAMGAIAVARRIGVPTEAIREALATYEGVENRFTISRGGGVTIVKDYISHPTGIQKVLESAVPMAEGDVYSVFKPYRYTLIDYLKDEYGQAFQGSDEVLLTKMYAADEDPIPGVDTMTMVEKVRDNDLKCTYIPDEDDIKGELHERVQPGDLVIFFGGDDFFQMAEEFEAELAQRAARTEPDDDQPKVDGPLAE